MQMEHAISVRIDSTLIQSVPLERAVRVDFYLPKNIEQTGEMNLLLINDGQDLVTMAFENILSRLYTSNQIKPLICVGIHCGDDRKNEYGMLLATDFKGRGAKAAQYQQFIFQELMPYIFKVYNMSHTAARAFAGFSLGGLNALDLVLNNSAQFNIVGVFSGSLWWRSKDKDDRDFNEHTDRLMHRQLNNMTERPALKFFFQCGELDEAEDRNKNGVIDSIDDTLDIIQILNRKGYRENLDYKYLQLPDGKHDVPTWARAWPDFLKWGWGRGEGGRV